MRVFLDACCVNRLRDDQTQERIRRGGDAIEFVLGKTQEGEMQWVFSEVLIDKIDRNPNAVRSLEKAVLLALASDSGEVTAQVMRRETSLRNAGYEDYDA